jgi:hypothetical protein
MNARIEQSGVLRLVAANLWLMLFLEPTTLLRTFGGVDPTHAVMAVARAFDMVFILLWLARVLRRPSGSPAGWVLLLLWIYPTATAIGQGPNARTYINDLILYLGFVAKIELVRVALLSPEARLRFHEVVRRYSLALTALAVGAVLLVYGAGLRAVGIFQIQIDTTPAIAFFAGTGRPAWMVALLVLTALAGKRMYLAGGLVIFLMFLVRRLRTSVFATAALASLLLGMVAFGAGPLQRAAELRGVSRSVGTATALFEGTPYGLVSVLELVDAVRFAEARSVVAELGDRRAFLFGAGYGVRYELRGSFLVEGLVTNQTERTHTNAHFSPLGIVLKFGIVGLALWTWIILVVFRGLIRRSSTGPPDALAQFALFALSGYLIESAFAYEFFAAHFVPFLLAIGLAPAAASQVSGVTPNNAGIWS